MRRSKSYFKKGVYNYRQAEGLPTVKQFIVTEISGKRCLLLRFENGTELKIDRMAFFLTQIDASGKIIDKTRIEYDDISFLPRSTYSHTGGIVIENDCTDFKVDVIYVISGKYKYENSNNTAVAIYEPRGYDEYDIIGSGKTKAKVKKVKFGHGIFAFMALIAVIMVTLCCYFAFTYNDDFGTGYDEYIDMSDPMSADDGAIL